MNWDTRLAILLMAILVILSLTGCGNAPVVERMLEPKQQEQVESESSGIPNFQGIADALGCVFAPDKCNQNK